MNKTLQGLIYGVVVVGMFILNIGLILVPFALSIWFWVWIIS